MAKLSDREKAAKKAGVAVNYSKPASQQLKPLAIPKTLVSKTPAMKLQTAQKSQPMYKPSTPKLTPDQDRIVRKVQEINFGIAREVGNAYKTARNTKVATEAEDYRRQASTSNSILGKIKDTTKQTIKKISNAPSKADEAIQRRLGLNQVADRTRNNRENTNKIMGGVGKLAYDIPKYVAREGLSAALSTKLGNRLGGRINPREDFGDRGADILGDGPIGSYQQRTAKMRQRLAEGTTINGRELKLSDSTANVAAPFAVAGSVALNTVFGGKSKRFAKGGKTLIESDLPKSAQAKDFPQAPLERSISSPEPNTPITRSEAPRAIPDTPPTQPRTREQLPKQNTNRAEELFEEADESGRSKVYANVPDGSGGLKKVEIGEFDENNEFIQRKAEDGRDISEVLDEDNANLRAGKRGVIRGDQPGDARAAIQNLQKSRRGFGSGKGRKKGLLQSGREKVLSKDKEIVQDEKNYDKGLWASLIRRQSELETNLKSTSGPDDYNRVSDELESVNAQLGDFKKKNLAPEDKAVIGGEMARKGQDPFRIQSEGERSGILQTEKYQGETDLTTKTLKKLEGRSTVSRQFIEDLTNQADLKQPEKDLFRKILASEGDQINVKDFASKVKSELLPLERSHDDMTRQDGKFFPDTRYEGVSLPDELKGPVAKYAERIYQSPIKTSAGDVHFNRDDAPNYFAHSRIEDLPVSTKGLNEDQAQELLGSGVPGNTRRVIEIQSDLFQKGRLESEVPKAPLELRPSRDMTPEEAAQYMAAASKTNYQGKVVPKKMAEIEARKAEIAKLEPYRNTWHERVIREELKKAAIDGKTKVQFPTGETAMKIEGLAGQGNPNFLHYEDSTALKSSDLTFGQKFNDQRHRGAGSGNYIIIEKTGSETFKALPLKYDAPEVLQQGAHDVEDIKNYEATLKQYMKENPGLEEEFSIAEKIDTNNPIYKFYEKNVSKYLSKFGGKVVTDKQGVSWVEVPVDKRMANAPVEAFAGVPAGIESDEEGNFSFDPTKAALGMAGGMLAKKGLDKGKGLLQSARASKLAKESPLLQEADKNLLSKLSSKQQEAFSKGTPQEQKRALEHLRLKNDLETNDADLGKNSNPLLSEAKKYSTPEEFVKAVGEVRTKAAGLDRTTGYKPSKLTTEEKALNDFIKNPSEADRQAFGKLQGNDLTTKLTDLWKQAQGGVKTGGLLQRARQAELGRASQNPQGSVLDSFLTQSRIPKTTPAGKPIIPPTAQNPRVNPSWVSKVGTSIREVVQDNWIRVKNLQKEVGTELNSKDLTPYQAETLMHGRIQSRLDTINETARAVDKEIVSLEKSFKDADFRKKVDLYLIAKHAPERNAMHGDGAAGMTNAESEAILKEVGGIKEVKEIGAKIKALNDETLEILKESQVISDETYNTLRATYKEHVPLQRVFEETDMDDYLVGKGLDVKTSGIMGAQGSDREVADIMTNVVANLEQAVVRAEKNRVNLATLKFAREHKDLGLFEISKPKMIGKRLDFSEAQPGMKLNEIPTGDKAIFETVDDPLVLTVRENGKPVNIRIKDPALAVALKAIGNEKLPPFLNFIGAFTRLYSGLATRFNPEFAFSNKLRDIQEMVAYMAAQKDIGFSGAAKTAVRDLKSTFVDVTAGMLGKNTEGARLYRQMVEDGGTTGGMALSTRQQIEVDLEDIRRMNRGGAFNVKNAGQKVLKAIDSWNEIFENSTRLSVYRTALDKGMSRDQAAYLAKNATINFNKKGTGGGVINAMYMFSNASIQGTTKLLSAMKNPKVAGAVVTTVGGSVWAVNSWNDKVDPEWREKVEPWDREANLVIVLPTAEGAKYVTLPVSWGLKPLKVMADYAYDASHGKAGETTGYKIAGSVLGSLWNAYNPVGGSSLGGAIMPSIGDVPLEVGMNKKWSGSDIHPEDKEGVPDSENFFKKDGVPSDKSRMFGLMRRGTEKLSQATGGEISINPANLKYALDQYLSGAGRAVSGLTETVTAIGTGSELQTKDTPFLRRFLKEKSPEEIVKSQKYDAKDALYENLKSLPKDEQPEKIQEYINSLPDEQRKGAAYGLMLEGFNTKGTSTSDDIIQMKPVYERVQQMKAEGQEAEAQAIVDNMSEEDFEKYKKVRTSVRSRNTATLKELLNADPKKAVEYARSLGEEEAQRLVDNLDDDEFSLYEQGK